MGTVQGTPVLDNPVQESLNEQAILQECKIHFPYLFMHSSVFDTKQLKNPADKVCFNSQFEPYFELVILQTHKTI